MDDPNPSLEKTATASSDRSQASTDRGGRLEDETVSQVRPTNEPPSLSDTCFEMKEHSIDEGQKLVTKHQSLGKPPTLTQACSAMKQEIVSEAERLYPRSLTGEKPEVGVSTAVKRESGHRSDDEHQSSEMLSPKPDRSSITEQAKKALQEANWFEQ